MKPRCLKYNYMGWESHDRNTKGILEIQTLLFHELILGLPLECIYYYVAPVTGPPFFPCRM